MIAISGQDPTHPSLSETFKSLKLFAKIIKSFGDTEVFSPTIKPQAYVLKKKSSVCFQKLTVYQLVMKLPVSYGTPRFINVFTKVISPNERPQDCIETFLSLSYVRFMSCC